MKRTRETMRILAVLVVISLIVNQVSLALTRDERRSIMKSCVLILAMKIQNGKVVDVPWSGSGTIVDESGFILTNYHVVERSGKWNTLGILVTSRSDEEPAPAYIAKTVAYDQDADLAVLQIVSDFQGKAVDFSKLGLIPVPLGNADDLELGDEITIFGYPGIGSNTITLTEGKIAGFLADEAFTYQRAWLKTDASIAGGNSGGTAVDESGKLVGIPTRGSMVDVRRIADTNGDGVINDEDSAVPTGGFINLMRPVNMAYELIGQARSGQGTPSDTVPSTNPTPITGSTLPSESSFSGITFASQVDENYNPLDSGKRFGTDATFLYAFSDFEGMKNGLELNYVWSLDDEELFSKTTTWPYGQEGTLYLYLTNSGDPMPAGTYRIELKIAGTSVASGEAVIGFGSPGGTGSAGGVTVSGSVVDAYNNKPIAGAAVIFLKPGVAVASFLRNQQTSAIAAYAETDLKGTFVSSPELERGQIYGAIVIAKGYETLAQDKSLTITRDMPNDLELETIALAPR